MTTIDIPEPVATFITAVNAQDEKTFLDAFADDGYVDDWGTRYNGRTAIKTWSDREFLGATGTLTPERVSRDDDTITVIGDWRSSFANGLSSFRFAVSGNKIASMTIREG